MNKRQLHHRWTKLRHVKPWYFLAIALVSTVICVFALRANNQHMISLRSAVYTADQDGTGVQEPLNSLQAYVTAHMNTKLDAGPNPVYPPIQLKYTYERLQQAQADALAKTNSQLYTAAQAYCEQQNPTDFSGHNRVPCIEQYVQSHGGGTLPAIPDALYKFAFVSPSWSPDLAGWSLVAAIVAWILFVISFAIGIYYKRQLK